MTALRALHRASGAAVGVFVAAHLASPVAAVVGLSVHQQVTGVLRLVYRNRIVEPVLALCVGWQVASGLGLAARGWRRRLGVVARLQASTGITLAL